ncbi:MAG: DedA family protein [Patescibacteria group bacterium]
MFDLVSLIKGVGYLGVGAIVFAESGLLIGLFLPGDSLLFTAGFLASQGFLSIVPLVLIIFVTAVLGDNTGYWFGKRFGPSVFRRRGSLLLDPEHIHRAEEFFQKHGPKTIILARFVPVIRSIAPILAGVGSMHWSTFFFYNVVGGLLWGVGVTLTGYYIGSVIPGVDAYIIPIALLIIVVSVAPGLWHLLRDKNGRAQLIANMKGLLHS